MAVRLCFWEFFVNTLAGVHDIIFRMETEIREAIFEQVAEEPFARKFALKLAALDDGYSRVEMTYTADMNNIFGLAHGGAVFALIDEAFQTACNSHGTLALALNLNITYIAPAVLGRRLTAEAREYSRTGRRPVTKSRSMMTRATCSPSAGPGLSQGDPAALPPSRSGADSLTAPIGISKTIFLH